jgi:hypothetical protein
MILKQLHEMGPDYPLVPLQGVMDELLAAFDGRLIQFQLLKSSLILCQNARSQKLQDPSHIFRQYEMNRAAQRPSQHNLTVCDALLDIRGCSGLHAHSDRPQRLVIILCLQSAEMPDNLFRLVELVAGYMQIEYSSI